MNKKNNTKNKNIDTGFFSDIFSIPVKTKKRKVNTRFNKLQAMAKNQGVILERCGSHYELWVLGTTAICSNLTEVEETLISHSIDGNL